jgi:hypothetical protein
VNEHDLRNHISYWLLISVLLETSQIDELDQIYIDWRDEQGIKNDEEIFFVMERSIKLLAKYLLKLNTWYHEVIFLFYF